LIDHDDTVTSGCFMGLFTIRRSDKDANPKVKSGGQFRQGRSSNNFLDLFSTLDIIFLK